MPLKDKTRKYYPSTSTGPRPIAIAPVFVGHHAIMGGHPVIMGGHLVIMGGHPVIMGGHPVIMGGHHAVMGGHHAVMGGHPVIIGGHHVIVGGGGSSYPQPLAAHHFGVGDRGLQRIVPALVRF